MFEGYKMFEMNGKYSDAKVMIDEAIAPTATITHRVNPIYNVKAS